MGLLLLASAATTPAPTDTAGASSNGPIVVVVLAVITLLGTVLTAMGPTFLEMAKGRGSRRPPPADNGNPPTVPAGQTPPPNPAPPLPSEPSRVSNQMVRSAAEGFDLLESAFTDFRSQRDAAMSRYDRVLDELSDAREIIKEQAVYIVQLEERAGIPRRANGGRHGSPTDPQPWGHR
jgi:hypothetical protein